MKAQWNQAAIACMKSITIRQEHYNLSSLLDHFAKSIIRKESCCQGWMKLNFHFSSRLSLFCHEHIFYLWEIQITISHQAFSMMINFRFLELFMKHLTGYENMRGDWKKMCISNICLQLYEYSYICLVTKINISETTQDIKSSLFSYKNEK